MMQKALESLPTRGAWIEIDPKVRKVVIVASLPTRGAWIEICVSVSMEQYMPVAPHTGSVD